MKIEPTGGAWYEARRVWCMPWVIGDINDLKVYGSSDGKTRVLLAIGNNHELTGWSENAPTVGTVYHFRYRLRGREVFLKIRRWCGQLSGYWRLFCSNLQEPLTSVFGNRRWTTSTVRNPQQKTALQRLSQLGGINSSAGNNFRLGICT